ncbi:MAG: HAD family hydrolase [Acidimicrobiales bacterium]
MVRRLLLWDIDGTLLRAGSVGADAFDLAIEDVLGAAPPGRVQMSGKTDPLIVYERLELLGIEPDPATVEAVLDRLVARLGDAAGRITELGRACPGVPRLLEELATRPHVASGCLTGNLRPNARVKLVALGLDRLVDLDLGAYGDDDIDRNALVPLARKRAAERLGAEVPADGTWVIGDTPRDLDCARAGGVRCLLVGTGTFTVDELDALGADATLPDLTDTEAVLELLAGAA